jgi:hypothetical protein
MKTRTRIFIYRIVSLLLFLFLILCSQHITGQVFDPAADTQLGKICSRSEFIDTIKVTDPPAFVSQITAEERGCTIVKVSEEDPEVSWLTGKHIIIDGTTITAKFEISGKTSVDAEKEFRFKVQIWDNNGPTLLAEPEYSLIMYPTPTAVDLDSSVCANETADIELLGLNSLVNGGTSYQWYSDPACTPPELTGSQTIVTVNDNQKFYAVVTNDNNCTDTATVTFTVDDIPTATLTADPGTTICAGESVTYTAGPIDMSNYEFFVNGGSKQNSASNTYTTTELQDEDVVSVGITDANTCKDTETDNPMTVNPTPTATISGSQNVCDGEWAEITIELTSGTPPWSFIYEIDEAGVDPIEKPVNHHDQTTYKIKDNPFNDTEYEIISGNNECGTLDITTSTATVTIDDCPADLFLVLDLSGSMLDPAADNYDRSKLDVLEEAVGAFIDEWEVWDFDLSPRIGFIYFKTNVFGYDDYNWQTTPSDFYNELTTNIETYYNDLTAMGGGLQRALEHLNTDNKAWKIVLFTDGMQNVNPMVNTITHEIKDGSAYYDSDVDPKDPPWNLDSIDARVYSIGVGITNTTYIGLLMDISARGSSYFSYTTSELDDYFTRVFVDIFPHSSPKIIDYRYGNLTGGTANELFTASRDLKLLMFKVMGDQNASLDYTLKKDGIDIPLTPEMIVAKNTYKLVFVKFPLEVNGQNIDSEGDWIMQISGNGQSAYKAAAIEDELKIKFSCSILAEDLKVGDDVGLEVRLEYQGEPVWGGCEVTAIVLKPGEDLGNLLARTKVPQENVQWNEDNSGPPFHIVPTLRDSFETGLSNGHLKFQVLMNNPEFVAKLNQVKRIVPLQSNGDGSFSGKYTETDYSGAYRVVFQVKGEVEEAGKINRTESKSFHVGYGNIDIKKSDLYVIRGRKGSMQSMISIRPRDVAGNYIGPDYLKEVKFSLSEGTVGRIIDRLNGRYSSNLNFQDNTDPTVNVTVFDKQVYEGPFSSLEEKFAFGVSASLNVPVGNFRNFYSEGPGGAIDFEWKLNRAISLDLQANYAGFSSGYSIVSGAAFAKVYLPLSSTVCETYIAAGAGVFKPKNLDPTYGIAGRAGYQRRLSSRKSDNKMLWIDLNHLWFDINATYSYLNVPNNDRDYLGIGIGLRYSF